MPSQHDVTIYLQREEIIKVTAEKLELERCLGGHLDMIRQQRKTIEALQAELRRTRAMLNPRFGDEDYDLLPCSACGTLTVDGTPRTCRACRRATAVREAAEAARRAKARRDGIASRQSTSVADANRPRGTLRLDQR